ncbi:isochorismate synthase DhbC [Saccharopolyspora sp. NFXS83]|uniref:isochorismate synthase DhbC n=1 Tax=Saccharopolyspora sp. NFXS83 TaxID=2993560 RepID=UPI00224B19B9|nr:isochorismate synthase DhbC [Saccharopolyspora sp. NFXS83]MCX2733111.1 isochorismate synthase DhbC [Saccharopolyspora sp. NFXS83]
MTTDSDTTLRGESDDLGEHLSPAELLAGYRAGSSFFFASPRGSMLARGVDAVVPKTTCSGGRGRLPEQVAEFLRHAEDFGRVNPLVVGAVPFGENLPAHLVLPSEVRRAAPLTAPQTPPDMPRLDYRLKQVPAPAEYERAVERVLKRLRDDEMSKVVLARSLELTTPDPVDPGVMLRNLAGADPGGYTYAVDLPRRGQDGSRDAFGEQPALGRTLLGASPELLVSRDGVRVRANPLAGSRPRSEDPVEDRRRADELLHSGKDLREHAAVVEAVVAALRPLCRDLVVPEHPSVVHTAAMWHLSTDITGELADPETSSLQLAVAMHPTPAVCGTPPQDARAAIAEAEPFERGFYTGMVGWCDASGDGEWVVTIRCAEIEDTSLRLYAGAGIVEGSEPADELAETSAKFRTALSAMGWSDAL